MNPVRFISARVAVECAAVACAAFAFAFAVFAWPAVDAAPAQERPSAPSESPRDLASSDAAERDLAQQRAGAAPFSYRNIYVPVDRLEEFARGYFPHDKAQFHELVGRWGKTARGELPPARIVQAEYLARLEGDHLVDGRARWRVIVEDRPARFDLSHSQLPLVNLAWVGERPEPARIERSADGVASISIARTGTLLGSWSLSASAHSPGANRFQWRPPAAARSWLLIDAPRDRRLEGDLADKHAALVEKLAEAAARDPSFRALFSDAPIPPDHERWLIAPAGEGAADFASLSASSSPPSPVVLLTERTDYRLGKHALDISANLTLDIRQSPLAALRIELPEKILVSSVKFGETELEHHIEASAAAPSPIDAAPAVKTLIVTMPAPLEGRQSIQIGALAPLEADRRWRVPRLQVADAFWHDGSIRLISHPELSIDRLELSGARQTRFTRASAGEPNEVREMQLHRADANVEAIVRRKPAKLHLESGLWVRFEAARTTAVLTADVSVAAGEVHSLTALAASDWIIDAIETEPADALEPIGLEALDDGRQRIDIRLRTPIEAGRPLRLKIRGRGGPLPAATTAAAAMAAATPLDRWRLVEFPEIDSQSRLAALSTGLGRLASAGDADLTRLDGARLAIRQRDLLPQATGADLVFRDDDSAAALVVAVELQRPAFDARLQTEAFVSATQVRERHHLRCQPAGAPVERLLVQFSMARNEPLVWRLADDSEAGIVARRLSPEEQSEANLAGGETWRIELRRARRSPFQLIAERVVAREGRHGLSLAWLPEAESQVSSVALFGAGETSFDVENEDAAPIVASQASVASDSRTDRYSLRAAYRYEAGRSGAIAIATSTRPGSQLVWCWDFQLESKLAGAGRDRHRATWRLENAGAASIDCRLPAEAKIDRVWIDGREASPLKTSSLKDPSAADAVLVSVPLPQGARHPCATIEFTTPSQALPWLGELKPVAVDVGCDVFAGRWLASLPAPWRPSHEEAPPAPGSAPILGWIAQRLAGPLWRMTDDAATTSLLEWGPEHLSGKAPEVKAVDSSAANSPRAQGQERSPDAFASLWKPAPRRLADDIAGSSWRTYSVALNGDRREAASTPTLSVYRPQFTTAIAGGALLATVALCLGVARRRFRALAPIAGAAAAAALLAPADWAPVATAVWQAVVLAAIAGMALPRRLRNREDVTRRLALRQGLRAALVSLAASSAFSGLSALDAAEAPLPTASDSPDAAKAAQNASAGEPIVYQILHPIDDELQPVGNYVYLPQPLYDALRRQSGQGGDRAPWRLTAAAYTATLARRDSESPWRVIGLTAKYSLEAASDGTRFVLPFDREDVYLPAEGARLDGRQAVFEWDSSGKGLAIPIESAGRHELELSLLPSPKAAASGVEAPAESDVGSIERGFEFNVLAHPSARFTLRAPPEAPAPRFVGALGAVRQLAAGEWRVDVGPATRIGLRWSENAADQRPSEGQLVDCAAWMHIRPGGVDLVVRLSPWRSEGAAPVWSPGEELTLRGDPNLVLVAGDDRQAATSSQATLIGPGEWRLAAPSAGEGKSPIELKFVVALDRQAASGAATIASPRLELDAGRVGRRWLAVSTADPLTLDDSVAGDPSNGQNNSQNGSPGVVASASIADFLNAWGNSNRPAAAPAIAFRQLAASGEAPAWKGAVRQRSPRTAARELLEISVDRRAATMRYEALLETSGGEVFEHRLTAPVDFDVQSASLVAEDEERVVRWAKSSGPPVRTSTPETPREPSREEITIFLNGSVGGPARLVVVGRMPVGDGPTWNSPIISLKDADRESWRTRIYRRPDVFLEESTDASGASRPPSDAKRSEGGSGESDWRPEWGRLCAAFESPTPTSRPFVVRANAPRVSCLALTAIERRDGDWMANVDCRWTIGEGLVDLFRLELPVDFEPAIDAEGAATTFEATGDPKRRRLIVRPHRAVGGTARIVLRGPLLAGTGVAAPVVTPLDAANVGEFVALPMFVDARPIAWSTRGLQPIPPPSPFASEERPDGNRQYFRAIDRFHASIDETAPGRREARIHLADYRLAYRAGGACHGVADFDLESGGLEECLLRLPAGLSIVSATVAELPAQMRETANGEWTLKLGPAQHPQRIELVFSGRLAPSPSAARERASLGEWRANVPELVGLPIDRTLWTLRGEAAEIRFGGWADDERVSAAQQDLVRLRTLHEFLKSPGAGDTQDSDGLQAPFDESRLWRRSWLARFVQTQATLTHSANASERLEGAGDLPPPLAFDPLAEAQALAGEIGDLPSGATAPASRTPDDPTSEDFVPSAALWERGESPHDRVARYSFPGSGPQVSLAFDAPKTSPSFTAPATLQIAAACIAFSLSLLAGRLLAVGGLRTWLARWPQFLLAIAGAAWWLWLSPASLGLAMMAVAAASAVWPSWRGLADRASRPVQIPRSSSR